MMVRPDIQIQTMIKAMTEVVFPALDPGNPMAQEQAQVIVGTLMLLGESLPRQFRYDCEELNRLTDFADELAGRADGGTSTAHAVASLTESAALGREVLGRATADPAEVIDAVRVLRAASSLVVDVVFEDPDAAPSRDGVRRTVVAMSAEQLLRERASVVLQGFEADPASLPAIGDLIGVSAK